MDTKTAIAAAKHYIEEVFSDEALSNLGLEEIEPDPATGGWLITFAFSRPWNSERRTGAQATLESIGLFSNLRRSYKVVSIDPEGNVVSLKSKPKADAE